VNITGLRCAVCRVAVPVDTTWPWRCPGGDDRHHVLHRVRALAPFRPNDHPNPFVRFDAELMWAAHANAHGWDFDRRVALVEELDGAVVAVDGVGFTVTPFSRRHRLSERLGFTSTGGLWVKDETGNVAGSHKARHLFSILLHLVASERLGLMPGARPRLAIASCGNAALAAATLAAATDWPIDVFVPPDVAASVLARLEALGAAVVVCARREGDPPGDPCVRAFREAVAAGAVPFSVQGPENALCLDGGRTIGWEMIEGLGHALDRWYVQVGGGALATCIAMAAGDEGIHPVLHAVQTQGCAPLERAWQRASEIGLAEAPRRWADCMWPWEPEPRSAASGILDVETYDWVGVVHGMAASGGTPVVVPEPLVVEATETARATTGIDVDATGAAGLAGVLARPPQPDERVAIVFSGRRR
jgi:threonine synthase